MLSDSIEVLGWEANTITHNDESFSAPNQTSSQLSSGMTRGTKLCLILTAISVMLGAIGMIAMASTMASDIAAGVEEVPVELAIVPGGFAGTALIIVGVVITLSCMAVCMAAPWVTRKIYRMAVKKSNDIQILDSVIEFHFVGTSHTPKKLDKPLYNGLMRGLCVVAVTMVGQDMARSVDIFIKGAIFDPTVTVLGIDVFSMVLAVALGFAGIAIAIVAIQIIFYGILCMKAYTRQQLIAKLQNR